MRPLRGAVVGKDYTGGVIHGREDHGVLVHRRLEDRNEAARALRVAGDGLNPPGAPLLSAVVRRFAPDARVVAASGMDGGESATMTSITLERAGGARESVILRQVGDANLAADPDAAENEARVLDALSRTGLPVPRALHLDQSRRLLPRPFLVVTFLEGAPDYDPSDRTGAAQQMAGFLARLHAIDTGRDDLVAVPRRHGPLDGPSSRSDRLPGAFRGARELLEASSPPPVRNPEALLHGDFWAGNVLWRDGRLSGVVDWEDAAVGDPLADLAIARVDMSWGFGREAMEAFTARYAGCTGSDLYALPYWDLRAALRQAPHATDYAEGWREMGRTDITGAVIRAAHTRLIDEAMAALAGDYDRDRSSSGS